MATVTDTRTVYVVMGNDYPAGVFDTEEAAETYCGTQADFDLARRIKELGPTGKLYAPRIHYRVYPFILNALER